MELVKIDANFCEQNIFISLVNIEQKQENYINYH